MRDLIVFGEDWGELPSSTQHLIYELSKDRKILWINSIGLRRPGFYRKDFYRVIKKVMGKIKSSHSYSNKQCVHGKNIRVFFPCTIPIIKNKFEFNIAKKIFISPLIATIKELKLKDPVIWCSLPTAVDYIDHIPHSSVLYYCCDDFGALAGVDHLNVLPKEAALAEKSDLIVTTNSSLKNKFNSSKTKELQHGVDIDLFCTPTKRADDLPDTSNPIAGYYGSIDNWLDQDLLCDVISKMPNWKFIFVGQEKVGVKKIKQFKNTIFLGYKEHYTLPTYSQHWNCSLLPFIVNDQIRHCNPLKLMEYIAVGNPVISTRFGAAEKHSKFVDIVDNSEQMINTIRLSLLKKNSIDNSTAVYRCAKYNSWKSKAKSISQWIEHI